MDPSELETNASPETAAPDYDLSAVLVPLLKGVIYQDTDTALWNALLRLQARVRDYVQVLGLELMLDEAEGYVFLRSHAEPSDPAAIRLPRLIPRRALSFRVSLLLALLRKKLAEFDATGGDTRLVLAREEIVDLIRVFLPEGSNEARLINEVDATINRIVDLGFLRRLKPAAGSSATAGLYEVRRILKAFVDAQWLAEFDARLADYRRQVMGDDSAPADD